MNFFSINHSSYSVARLYLSQLSDCMNYSYISVPVNVRFGRDPEYFTLQVPPLITRIEEVVGEVGTPVCLWASDKLSSQYHERLCDVFQKLTEVFTPIKFNESKNCNTMTCIFIVLFSKPYLDMVGAICNSVRHI